jgi:hypothetical protein
MILSQTLAVAVSAPTATAPMAPITPAAQEQRTAETTQSQTQAQTSPKHLSPASKIPFQGSSKCPLYYLMMRFTVMPCYI